LSGEGVLAECDFDGGVGGFWGDGVVGLYVVVELATEGMECLK